MSGSTIFNGDYNVEMLPNDPSVFMDSTDDIGPTLRYVYDLAVSPDGTKLAIAGFYTKFNGDEENVCWYYDGAAWSDIGWFESAVFGGLGVPGLPKFAVSDAGVVVVTRAATGVDGFRWNGSWASLGVVYSSDGGDNPLRSAPAAIVTWRRVNPYPSPMYQELLYSTDNGSTWSTGGTLHQGVASWFDAQAVIWNHDVWATNGYMHFFLAVASETSSSTYYDDCVYRRWNLSTHSFVAPTTPPALPTAAYGGSYYFHPVGGFGRVGSTLYLAVDYKDGASGDRKFALFSSTDDGDNWVAVVAPETMVVTNSGVLAISDPAEPIAYYVGADSKLHGIKLWWRYDGAALEVLTRKLDGSDEFSANHFVWEGTRRPIDSITGYFTSYSGFFTAVPRRPYDGSRAHAVDAVLLVPVDYKGQPGAQVVHQVYGDVDVQTEQRMLIGGAREGSGIYPYVVGQKFNVLGPQWYLTGQSRQVGGEWRDPRGYNLIDPFKVYGVAPGAPTLFDPSGSNGIPVSTWELDGAWYEYDDRDTEQVTAPFTLQHGLNSYSHFEVDSNGRITFGDGIGYSDYPPYPDLPWNDGRDSLFPFFYDYLAFNWDGDEAAAVYTGVVGTAPNRLFIIEWFNVYARWAFADDSHIRFQVIFEEGSPDFEFHYQGLDITNYDLSGGDGLVGIQGDWGTLTVDAWTPYILSDATTPRFHWDGSTYVLVAATHDFIEMAPPVIDQYALLTVDDFASDNDYDDFKFALRTPSGDQPIEGWQSI